jgi:hypothetical protein
VDVAGSDHNPERRLRVQPAPERALRCARCEAPVDAIQRYCIVCGAHQLHVEDPVARHMSTLQARRRATHTTGRDTRSTITIGRALLVACLLVALMIGAIAGRAATSGDGAVVAALRAMQSHSAAATTTRGGGAHATSASRPREARRLQKSTGGNYVRSQQALPNQISVP